MRFAICEEDMALREQIRDNLNAYSRARKAAIDSASFTDVRSLSDALTEPRAGFHAVILGIRLPHPRGIEAAHALRRVNPRIPLILIVSDPAIALDGYEVGAIACLTWPLRPERLYPALDRVLSRCASVDCVLPIQTARQITRVIVQNVAYIEKCDHKCLIHLTDGEILSCSEPLKYFELRLKGNPAFMLAHQSFLVNAHQVYRLDKHSLTLEMADGTRVPVARTRLRSVVDRILCIS